MTNTTIVAENYYTADYPEDEVESDDEFDRDPYRYRTDNAAELEEFNVLDYSTSDWDTSFKSLRSHIGNALVDGPPPVKDEPSPEK